LGFGTSGAAGRNSKVQYARTIRIVGFTTNWSRTASNQKRFKTQGNWNMNMKLTFAIACGFAALIVTPALAQTNATTPKAFVMSQTNQINATVEAIDPATRKVTLRGPDGNSVKVALGEDVRNFNQIKKGDRVNVTYRESVALALGKPGEPLTPTSRIEAATRAPNGENPGAAAASVTQTSVLVEDVNRDNHEVTLRGPDGDVEKIQVDPSVGNLEHINKGDRVNITLTQALAISVKQPDQNP
jgi:Cu/Ag efflux protein CusF